MQTKTRMVSHAQQIKQILPWEIRVNERNKMGQIKIENMANESFLPESHTNMLTSRYPKRRSCQQIKRNFEEIFAANKIKIFDYFSQHPLAYEWDN